MTHSQLRQLFVYLNKPNIVVAHDNFVKQFIAKHDLSVITIRRWRRDGYEFTVSKVIRYCAVCDKEFYHKKSRQLTCGSSKCHMDHLNFKARQNYKKRPTVIASYNALRAKRMQRRVSAKLATRTGQAYTEEEMKLILNYKFSAKELAYKLSRSIGAIEGTRSRHIKKALNETNNR